MVFWEGFIDPMLFQIIGISRYRSGHGDHHERHREAFDSRNASTVYADSHVSNAKGKTKTKVMVRNLKSF